MPEFVLSIVLGGVFFSGQREYSSSSRLHSNYSTITPSSTLYGVPVKRGTCTAYPSPYIVSEYTGLNTVHRAACSMEPRSSNSVLSRISQTSDWRTCVMSFACFFWYEHGASTWYQMVHSSTGLVTHYSDPFDSLDTDPTSVSAVWLSPVIDAMCVHRDEYVPTAYTIPSIY